MEGVLCRDFDTALGVGAASRIVLVESPGCGSGEVWEELPSTEPDTGGHIETGDLESNTAEEAQQGASTVGGDCLLCMESSEKIREDRMAVIFSFSGSSDDLIQVTEHKTSYVDGEQSEISETSEEYSVGGRGRQTFGIASKDGLIKIIAIYDGTWFFAPRLWDEGDELPDYAKYVTYQNADNDYSILARIKCPDGSKVFPINS